MTMRYTKAPTERQLKVSGEIKKIISQAFLIQEVYHPMLEAALLSVAEVRISPDLKLATIFYSYLYGQKEQLQDILTDLLPEFRHLIAKKMQLRFVPEIRFVYDESGEHAYKINNLLKE